MQTGLLFRMTENASKTDNSPCHARFHCALRTLAITLAALISLAFTVPAYAAALEDDDLLLLDFLLERQPLATSITGYAVGDTAAVSLAEAGAALDFPIIVEAATGKASGSFIRPDRTFTLNYADRFVEIEGRRVPFTQDEVFVHRNAIFVTIDTFSRWFPVNLRYHAQTLSVDVEPRERLPIQERWERRDSASQFSNIGPATLPRIETPYRLLGSHAADVGLGYSIRRPLNGGKAITGLNYSSVLGGDLAYMDSRIYLNGNHLDPLAQARMSLSRDNLRLPLGLRYVEIGDIVPVYVSGLSYNGVERGLLLQGGGSATGRDDLISTDIINISGDALEGWDVELFQNNMRVGFQTIGANGRYNFTDIEPASGENRFDLVFYGPAGERRTETVTRYNGMVPDQPGSVRYQFSASQKGEPLYDNETVANPSLSDRGSARLAAGMEIRLLPRLSVRGSWNSLMVNNERLNYYNLGASTSWRDVTFSVSAIQDGNGTRWDGSIGLPVDAKARFWGFDTRLSHTQYAQAVQADDGSTLNLNSRTGITLTGPIGPVATHFALFHNHEATRNSNAASAGFTFHRESTTLGNTLNYYQFGRATDGTKNTDVASGSAFFSTRLFPLSVRGGLDYLLKPSVSAQRYFIDSTLNIAQDMSVNFGLTYDPLTDLTRYTSGLNWVLPQAVLSPRINYDSDGQYSGFVYASFSLAPRADRAGILMSNQSLATNGTVAARVFLDHDNSADFSEGDEPLPDVSVKALQSYRTGKTDKSGVAYLSSLSSARATDVVVDTKTLPSTQMTSIHAGNSVRPRAAVSTVIDFPVIPTGEIDGNVFVQQGSNRSPLAGAMVELRDLKGEVVAFKISAYDGFFVFTDVPYAAYTLNLAGERRSSANEPKLTLNRDKGLFSNINIIVTPPIPVSPAGPDTSPRSEITTPIATTPVIETPVMATPIIDTPAVAKPVVPEPAAATPEAAAIKPASAPPSPKPVIVRKPADGRLVQLGVFSKSENAQAHREKMLALNLMKADQVEITSVDLGARGIMYRVVATPVTTTADRLCALLKKRGAECFTITQ